MKLKLIITTASLLVASSFANAYTNESGTVSYLYAAGGTNFGYRAALAGNPGNCTGGFIYTNKSDDNYNAYVVNLVLAYTLGKTVNVTLDTSSGYCHILEIQVSG